MKKYFLIPIILIILFYFYYINTQKDNKYDFVCDQSATTTDCAVLEKIAGDSKNNFIQDQKIDTRWEKFENKDLGITFLYPTKEIEPRNGNINKGDTGFQFSFGFDLDSGAHIWAISMTSDYGIGKDAPGVPTEGFVFKDGKYYIISRGEPVSVPIVPDEIIKLKDGGEALVIYGKNYDNNSDFTDSPMGVILNISKNLKWTGIGFLLENKNYESKPASKEDIETLKKIINPIEFI